MPIDHPELVKRLEKSGITAAVAEKLGVRQANTIDDLPEHARWAAAWALPALVFEWVGLSGDVVEQVNPLTPKPAKDGRPQKYLWPKGVSSVLGVVGKWRSKATTAVFVEGTRQARVVRRYLGPEFNVIAIGGCSSWTEDGVPLADLVEHVDGRDAIAIFDADLGHNIAVWTAASKFKDAAVVFGAKSLRFVTVPGTGTTGIDDVLGRLDSGKRAEVLERLLAGAAARLPGKPKGKAAAAAVDWAALGRESRPTLDVTDDRHRLALRVIEAMVGKRDRKTMFRFGNGLSELNRDLEMIPIRDDRLISISQHVTRPVFMIQGVGLRDSEYTTVTQRIIRSEAPAMFTPLERVARAPFLRLDGSVCTAVGYDPDTRTLLLDNLDVEVPTDPSDTEVRAAVKLLLDEWLGDFPFADEASRAGALALVLTTFVRSHFPIVPLAVVDGLQAGVGKGLLCDVVTRMVLGQPSEPTIIGDDPDEAKKAILAMMSKAPEIVFLDETHVISGVALAAALTAPVYQGRILGHSEIGAFPNRATWVAAGNQIQLLGDLYRRCYRIALYPEEADHENQGGYRHPNLSRWTDEHRTELQQAALTICRSWFALGCPEAESVSFHFGSFEQWQSVVGGILESAGVPGFLDNVMDWRGWAAPDRESWDIHIEELVTRFGFGRMFSTAEVRNEIHAEVIADPFEWNPDGPPLSDAHRYTRELGTLYRSKKDTNTRSGARLRRSKKVRSGGRTLWYLEAEGPISSGLPRSYGGLSEFGAVEHVETPVQHPHQENHASEKVRVSRTRLGKGVSTPSTAPTPDYSDTPTYDRSIQVIDLETDSAELLWTAGPEFQLAEVTSDGAPLDIGRTLVAHNGFGYDFQVLARHRGLDIIAAADDDRLIDTAVQAVLDEPIPGGFPTGRVQAHYQSLDAVAARNGGPAKTTSWRDLVKIYGGPRLIPLDVLTDYCAGDVAATEPLVHPLSDYDRREHRIMGRLTGSITFEGFRVDTELLTERVEAGKAVVARVTAELVERYGLPTVKADGKPAAQPYRTKAGKAALMAAFTDLGTDPQRWPQECRTGKGEPSFGADSLDYVIAHFAERIPAVADLARTISEGNGVRSVYQTVQNCLSGDRVHPSVFPAQASGRFSVTDPGLTVMGKRGGRHHEREVFLPDEGCVLLCADFDQVDARAVAAHCQDPGYLALFEPGRDSHEEIADLVWHVRDGKHGPYRNRAKVIGHGWNYGMRPPRIASESGVPLSDAERFDITMRDRFPKLVEWKADVVDIGGRGGELDNGFGRRLIVERNRAYTQAPALMGQSAARDIICEAVLRLPARVARMIRAIVHDELVFSIPVAEIDDVAATVVDAMTFDWAPPGKPLRVPITASTEGPGINWGACYGD